MIFHASIAAKDPQHVAEVVGELWGGEAIEFLPLNNGSWMAVASDDRNTALEVYPAGKVLDAEAFMSVADDPEAAANPKPIETHLAIGSVLSADEVKAIGEREGWLARPMRRKMGFDVIELWVENRVMLEVLTDYMQKEYLESATTPRWHAAMNAFKEAQAAASKSD